MGTFRYKAFISYSHRDRDWAAWLQRSLERYRVPRRLVGSKGEFGPVPRRLSPVFRDREDLSSAADLSTKVKQCLEDSESMIVVCSPAATQSIWVNEEVRYFRSLGRENRILALIVDGEPQPDQPESQCFPEALITSADGVIREPLAADARKFADGKLLAKLKIISGVLGIRLDELRRRDMQRRNRLWMTSAGGAMVIAVAMSVLAIMAVTARDAAENRREHAEDLVGYMVGDLRSRLDEAGRLDILEGMGGRVSEYLETLDPSEVTDESLSQQALVWRQLGEVGMDQGDLNEALRTFSTSRDIYAELYRRNPENAEYLFELGNSEFWVGYVHLETGDFEKAEKALTTYMEYAYRLVELEPGNPKWLMETSYAHNNLAALMNERRDASGGAALTHIKTAVEINRIVIEMAPDNALYRSEYSEALAWLADTQLLVCDLGDALISRQEQVAMAREQFKETPGNFNLKSRYAYSLTGLANVSSQVGLSAVALENYARSQEILGQMSIVEPSNVEHRFTYLMREVYAAGILAASDQLKEALVKMEMVRGPLLQVLEAESFENLKRHISWVSYLLAWSDMQWRAGKQDAATALLSEAVDHLGRLMEKNTDRATYIGQILTARFLYWQQQGKDLFDSHFAALGRSDNLAQDRSCQAQASMVKQAIMTEDLETARKLTADLLARGFYEPGFIRICRQYDLCQ